MARSRRSRTVARVARVEEPDEEDISQDVPDDDEAEPESDGHLKVSSDAPEEELPDAEPEGEPEAEEPDPLPGLGEDAAEPDGAEAESPATGGPSVDLADDPSPGEAGVADEPTPAPDDEPVPAAAAGADADAEAVVQALDVEPAFELVDESPLDEEARASREAVEELLKQYFGQNPVADDADDETPLPDPASQPAAEAGESEALALLRRGKATRAARIVATTGLKREKKEKAPAAPLGDATEITRENLIRSRDGWYKAVEDVLAAINALLDGQPDHTAYAESTNRLHAFGSQRRKQYDRLSLIVKPSPKKADAKPAEASPAEPAEVS